MKYRPWNEYRDECLKESKMKDKYLPQFDTEQDRFDLLPRGCMIRLPTGGKGFVTRGLKGYYKVHPATDIKRWNEERGISKFQQEAMLNGSMFGWDVPAADPDFLEKEESRKLG